MVLDWINYSKQGMCESANIQCFLSLSSNDLSSSASSTSFYPLKPCMFLCSFYMCCIHVWRSLRLDSPGNNTILSATFQDIEFILRDKAEYWVIIPCFLKDNSWNEKACKEEKDHMSLYNIYIKLWIYRKRDETYCTYETWEVSNWGEITRGSVT